jgi:hypothetical protein
VRTEPSAPLITHLVPQAANAVLPRKPYRHPPDCPVQPSTIPPGGPPLLRAGTPAPFTRLSTTARRPPPRSSGKPGRARRGRATSCRCSHRRTHCTRWRSRTCRARRPRPIAATRRSGSGLSRRCVRPVILTHAHRHTRTHARTHHTFPAGVSAIPAARLTALYPIEASMQSIPARECGCARAPLHAHQRPEWRGGRRVRRSGLWQETTRD